ncbi:MAG: glucuronyl esterase domain-containing protein [Promethearchaeota archaeon]
MKVKKILPNPFILLDGTPITSKDQWNRWCEETKEMILELAYGTMPEAPEKVEIDVATVNQSKKSDYKETDENFKIIKFQFFPKESRKDVSFEMEITIHFPDEKILERTKSKINNFGENGLPCVIYIGDNPCKELYNAGYVIINYRNNQLEPMRMGNPIIGPAKKAYNELFPNKYSWGSIAVWAWGAMRIVDYIQNLSQINKDQIIITGHSRNGKTALLAGALDERIAIVNPAGSGCAGAASYLVLDEGCEDIAALTDKRRWWAWMNPEFAYYGYREEQLIFDQHFVMGLVAPRPLLRTEGILDEWANPRGTAAAFLATEEIYKFLGVPKRNQLFLRAGGHEHNHQDLMVLLDFANFFLFGIPQKRIYKDLICAKSDFPIFMDWKSP